MRTLGRAAFLASLLLSSPIFADGLACRHIYPIQRKFLRSHILYESPTKDMERAALDEFIKSLDPEKIYFLNPDIAQIKRKNKRLFADLRRRNCRGLYFIYDIYRKRVSERLSPVFKRLRSPGFQLEKELSYIADTKNRSRFSDSKEADAFMKAHVQYQVSQAFLVEEDLPRSVKYISQIFKAFQDRINSWKPHLNKREKRLCSRSARKKEFSTCKTYKWLSQYLDSYARSLDSHSSYLDSSDMEEFKISMELKLEGIGATLSSRFGYTVVEELVDGGAAARSGALKEKDKILAVGQEKGRMVDIRGEALQDVVSLIRGKKGSPVYLKVLREEKPAKKTAPTAAAAAAQGQKQAKLKAKVKVKKSVFEVKIIRDTVRLKERLASLDYADKSSQGASQKIALIHVPSFYGSPSPLRRHSVSRDVRRLLVQAQNEKADAVLLDLSSNRGGPLDEAVDMTGFFFARGSVVKQSERHIENYRILKDKDTSVVYKGPLVILVNRFSASAAEIVSGALKDYSRAVIVGGERTFGKGSVQSVDVLPYSLGAVKTTVGLYFTPSGRSTQKSGVQSHIALPSVLNIEGLGEQSLDRALPAQKIKPFRSGAGEIFSKNEDSRWTPVTGKMIDHLRDSSGKRVAHSQKFKEVREKLAKIQKERKDRKKAITIGEVLERRLEDDEKDDILRPPQDRLKMKREKYLSRADVDEALNITADLARLVQAARLETPASLANTGKLPAAAAARQASSKKKAN